MMDRSFVEFFLGTCSGKIKKLLDEKKDASVMAEIELMIIEFNFFNNDKKDKTTGNGEK